MESEQRESNAALGAQVAAEFVMAVIEEIAT